MFSSRILTVLDALTAFAEAFGTFLFTNLAENLVFLQSKIPWFSVDGFFAMLDMLDPELTEWLLTTPMLVLLLGSGVVAYSVYTIVKYILDIVL